MLYAENVHPNTLNQWLRLHFTPLKLKRLLRDQWAGFEGMDVHQPLAALPLFWREKLADISDDVMARDVRRLQRWLDADERNRVLTRQSPEFPLHLKEIDDGPWLLFVSGDLSFLQRPAIAIVGSRKATPMGISLAEEFSKGLGAQRLCVVSGMAMGIDAAAHRAALAHGFASIGVLGCGIDRVYPARHRALYGDMREQGLLISEYLPGEAPRVERFPQRNRIISGLSKGVLVVEANIRSGSLQTAKHALEQNRNVYALPGAIRNPAAEGCNRLIQQGATLVTCVDDILQDYPTQEVLWPVDNLNNEVFSEKPSNFLETGLANPHLLANVDFETTALEVLIARSGLGVSDVVNQLISLELAGWIKQVPGGYVRVRR
ncbi:DNA-protecting protein DprA [Aliidiomarina halalkaliphila]|uniref:DNA-protecting protein DprA n=1 Tax=Aliidiomarina halalkaliphila TaxID=2593535 RepID=A0A552X148_9GAMM|nr:DNA-processing protein DprA [Aliidiomarina halalkaliphila]TRW48770.1 DNA-protecting protein DprA [Aliidiomarina halalkaliphila]